MKIAKRERRREDERTCKEQDGSGRWRDSGLFSAEKSLVFLHIDSGISGDFGVFAVQNGTDGTTGGHSDHCDLCSDDDVCRVCHGQKDAESQIFVGIGNGDTVFRGAGAGVAGGKAEPGRVGEFFFYDADALRGRRNVGRNA